MPPRCLLSLLETAARWSVSAFDVVTWALEGLLSLSIASPPVRIGPAEFLSGVVDVEPTYVLPLFRRDGAPMQSVSIRCVRNSDKKPCWIVDPVEGIIITAGDVFVRRAEIERFEKDHRIFDGDKSLPATRRPAGAQRPGPGVQPRHDWDSFYAALVRRIHEHGLPSTQAELVREMRDWFEQRDDERAPDESTIARKIRVVWHELHRS